MTETILEIKDLRVSYDTYAGEVQSVRGISFDVKKGETVAIVGESGCGKSVTAKSIMQLIAKPGRIKEGSSIVFDGRNVLKMSKKELRAYRGSDCAMIFQDALTSLDPTMRVGKQIAEVLTIHGKCPKKEAAEKAVDLLRRVGIPNAELRAKEYPHQFSGGMRQRAMIATALAGDPKLLIADEPTTALDVTIQAQIIDLMKELQQKTGAAIVLITHDLGVVADIADRICVMYSGKIVERGASADIFYRPKHPYTVSLLKAVPRLDLTNKQTLATIDGTPPDLLAPPAGCPFSTRCKYCMPVCKEEMPGATAFGNGHEASCWLHDPRAPKVEGLFCETKEACR
ncbi:MAG: ABC transporter ATP-binding protein [Clostridia bacterium]|nr:ABC transporter ATP-binding protein [Clostridia bacterium]